MHPTTVLSARRNADGGFGPVLGASSEPEATALAAIALGDPKSAAWVEDAQELDGSVGVRAGQVFRDATPVAVLAMQEPDAIARAASWVVGSLARSEPSTEALPHDPDHRGWPWTTGTFGWVEPTAWGVLSLRALGEMGEAVDDGVAMLRDRECVDGGWNYGNRIVLGEALPAFVQTTGVALIALRGLTDPMIERGLRWLRGSWEKEIDGLLSVAVGAAALRLYRAPEAPVAAAAVRSHLRDGGDPDTIALAWAAIALGDGLSRLEVE